MNYRQGDVLIMTMKGKKIPVTFKRKADNIVIEGEISGHKHEIENGRLYEKDDKIIIEVDGPTHWSPIYGDEELQKVVIKDSRKDKALIANGWNILRVQDSSGSTTRARFKRVLDVLTDLQYSKAAPTTWYVRP